jgi:SAM-dependent methyltransferase
MTDSLRSSVLLNLGCGNKRIDGYLGVDRYPCAGADILCDLNGRLPFENNTVNGFLLDNVIEHIPDIPALMSEIVRTGKQGARVSIITPHFTSLSSWKDPTHLHHLSYFSFDHFEKSSVSHYVGGGLRVVSKRLSFGGGLFGLVGRLLFMFSPEVYEKRYCFIFRASTLSVELEVVQS